MTSIELVSGWIGGSLGILATHPIDTVRVRMQNGYRNGPQSNITYYSLIRHLRNTLGFTGLYRGVIPPVACRGFSMGLNRVGYKFAEQHFTKGDKHKKLKGKELGITGAFAGFCSGVGDHWIYLVKCRAQTTKSVDYVESFSSYWKMSKDITRNEGIKGWTKGFIPGSICVTTSYAVLYLIYDELRSRDYNLLISGSAAAVLSWPIGLPFDTLRVRMQCEKGKMLFSEALFQMYLQPIRFWFVGYGATIARAAPRYAICMWSIEKSNHYLNNITKTNNMFFEPEDIELLGVGPLICQ